MMIARSAPLLEQGPYPPIDRLLRSAERRDRLVRLATVTGLSILGATFLALLFALLIGAFPSPRLRTWFWAAEIALLTFSTAGAILWPLKPLRPTDPRLRSLLRSVIELRDTDLTRPEAPSGVLILAQARFAAARLTALDLQATLPARSAWIAAAGAAGALCLLAAATTLKPVRQGLAGLWHLSPSQQKSSPAGEPITGDIELTYLYPAHTHLSSRTVTGTSGEIEAPAGTQVRITTRADRQVRDAFVVVNGRALPLTVSGGRSLSGSFLIEKAGSYFFRFRTTNAAIVEGPPIPIAVQVDAPPEVSLESPADDLEVDPHQVVTLRYRASDDYGISELRLRYRLPGASEDSRITLEHPGDPPLHLTGETHLDLAPLHLAPGDRLNYAIEALDNDAVAGTKLGQSRSQTLRVFSAAEHHREALARVRALWERMVGLLGDRLEDPDLVIKTATGSEGSKSSAADTRALALSDDLLKASVDLRKDSQSPKTLWQALSNIGRAERTKASQTMDARDLLSSEGATVGHLRLHAQRDELAILKDSLEAEAAELERDVIYLESLLDRQTMEDLVALTRELSSRRRDLADLIDRYNKTKNPELRAEIQAQLERLKTRQSELLARMAELAKGISDEHLNREATEQMAKEHDIGSGLDQVEQKLASGDFEGALKALDAVGNTLEELQKRLASAAEAQGTSQGYSPLTRQLSELKQGLADLTQREKRLQQETDKIRERARQNQERHAPSSPQAIEKLKAETQRAQVKLSQIPQGAFPYRILGVDSLAMSRERTDELAKALDVKDLDQALHSANEAVREVENLQLATDRDAVLRSLSDLNVDEQLGKSPDPEQRLAARQRLQEAAPLLRDVRATLAKMFPDESTMLSPEDQTRLSQLAREQAGVREKQAELQQGLRDVGKQAPVFDPAAEQAMEEAGSQMRRAQQSLAMHRASEASEREQGALQQLGKLQDAMKGSGQSQGAGGIPNPFAMTEPGGPGGDNGESGEYSEHEKVNVPGADQYRVPPEFRRDILDAMKQQAPEAYEEQVKKYYREIVK
jgi:hypothetical protein